MIVRTVILRWQGNQKEHFRYSRFRRILIPIKPMQTSGQKPSGTALSLVVPKLIKPNICKVIYIIPYEFIVCFIDGFTTSCGGSYGGFNYAHTPPNIEFTLVGLKPSPSWWKASGCFRTHIYGLHVHMAKILTGNVLPCSSKCMMDMATRLMRVNQVPCARRSTRGWCTLASAASFVFFLRDRTELIFWHHLSNVIKYQGGFQTR